MTTKFSMIKWYMDCIDNEGNTFVGYSAILNWLNLNINYTSQIIYTQEGGYEQKSGLGRKGRIDYEDKHFIWEDTKTKSRGDWYSLNDSISSSLLTSKKGEIDWCCIQPKAKTEVLSFKNSLIKGLGYTEKLTMTIKPWELPIDQLRWGRFLSKNYAIVWIKWIGSKPVNLLYINGSKISDAEITDEFIGSKSEGVQLFLQDQIVLRKGSLLTTVLSPFPWVSKLFPSKILTTFECKWRSRGVLKIKNVEVDGGWVIHELIRWT